MSVSPWGVALAAVMLAPSLVLWAWPPRMPLPEVPVRRALLWMERGGQAACVVAAVLAPAGAPVWGWAIPMGVAAAGYYALWGRYLRDGRAARSLYRSWASIPVPLAVFPVVVFTSAAAWLSSPWLAGAAAVLAAGHIPASLRRARPH